ncbi:MAG: hypothetical protein C5B48_04465, partial [Candidatus Rokuibacteriota bacterium]
MYGRINGHAALLAAVVRDGAPELHAWPRGRDGAFQFVVSWSGAPAGRRDRPLYAELWRRDRRDGVVRLWSTDRSFPE